MTGFARSQGVSCRRLQIGTDAGNANDAGIPAHTRTDKQPVLGG